MANSPGFLGKHHADKTREKIQVTQLVNRLQDCAMGNVAMDAQQLRATEVLLRKALPDLQAIELTGSDGAPIDMSLAIKFVDPDSESV